MRVNYRYLRAAVARARDRSELDGLRNRDLRRFSKKRKSKRAKR